MAPDLNQMSIFAGVVEAGGFTAAAKTLGMPKSTVSKRIAELEERLGARLLQRSTRRMKLTPAGAAYYEECRRIVADARAADRAATADDGVLRGLVRVTAPLMLEETVAPVMERFVAENPNVTLDLWVTNRRIDLVEEGVDLAIRAGMLPDSSLVARRLGEVQRCLCASPAYLARSPAIRKPADLRKHECIAISGAGAQTWTFERGDKTSSVTIGGRYLASSGSLMRRGALAGLGIASVPEFFVADDIVAGRLVRILDGWTTGRSAVHLVYPNRRHASPSVRVLIDWLMSTFVDNPPWTRRAPRQTPEPLPVRSHKPRLGT